MMTKILNVKKFIFTGKSNGEDFRVMVDNVDKNSAIDSFEKWFPSTAWDDVCELKPNNTLQREKINEFEISMVCYNELNRYTLDEINDMLIDWAESKDIVIGGSVRELSDGYSADTKKAVDIIEPEIKEIDQMKRRYSLVGSHTAIEALELVKLGLLQDILNLKK